MTVPAYLDLTRSDDETMRTIALMLAMVAERRNFAYELIEIPGRGCVMVVSDVQIASLILANVATFTKTPDPLMS